MNIDNPKLINTDPDDDEEITLDDDEFQQQADGETTPPKNAAPGNDPYSLSASSSGPFHPALGENKLRKFIRETLTEDTGYNSDKAKNLIKNIIVNADVYANSTGTSQNLNKDAAQELAELVSNFEGFVKWGNRQRKGWVSQAQEFLDVANSISQSTSFWKRPKFLNVEKYADDTKAKVGSLRNIGRGLWNSLK